MIYVLSSKIKVYVFHRSRISSFFIAYLEQWKWLRYYWILFIFSHLPALLNSPLHIISLTNFFFLKYLQGLFLSHNLQKSLLFDFFLRWSFILFIAILRMTLLIFHRYRLGIYILSWIFFIRFWINHKSTHNYWQSAMEVCSVLRSFSFFLSFFFFRVYYALKIGDTLMRGIIERIILIVLYDCVVYL